MVENLSGASELIMIGSNDEEPEDQLEGDLEDEEDLEEEEDPAKDLDMGKPITLRPSRVRRATTVDVQLKHPQGSICLT